MLTSVVAQTSVNTSEGVTLQATPRHTQLRGTVTLTGQVYGPIPKSGVPLALEVHYLGRWDSSSAHTQSNGHFTLHYRFGGVTGRFPFRVRAEDPANGFP